MTLCMVEVIGIQDYDGTVHGRGIGIQDYDGTVCGRGDWNTRLR